MSTPAQTSVVGDILPGYSVDGLIFDSETTRIYQARRLSDDCPVMLKSSSSDFSAREANACLKNEFDIAKRFRVPHVIQAYELEKHRNRLVLVLEDFGGDSLDNLVKQRSFTLEEVLDIAVKTCTGLRDIHAEHIIHKDITPSNIVYNPESRILKIIDFGISSFLSREQAAISSPRMVEASLPYMSPEQTGRMNRSIDFRTDFYSLGATLYGLLTGQPMFQVDDSLEWFHCHIARQPMSPRQVNPDVPQAVSDIVMKLLSKMAEDRYQSAQGVLADFEICQQQLQSNGVIDAFPLAQQDRPTQLQIPQRLYGREKELTQLLDSFHRVSQGENELTLVAGYSGIGKTCLIKELYKPITERGGHLITGKFDQLNRDIPYSAVSVAFRDLVRQLLTESEQQLTQWKETLLEALGGNAKLMIDLAHELEIIIGPQPEVPELQPVEAERRFHREFQKFIQVFCKPDSPLVLFLDDLQWADSASLKLLDLILSEEYGIQHVLIIGAYRDNEVSPSHGFSLVMKDLREKNCRINDIKLKPLGGEDITEMLCDTLGLKADDIAELAQLVENKTGGNPFFTEEFLRYLYKEGLLAYSHQKNCWDWDIERIRNQNMTDNVVELMTEKLQQFPSTTLDLLTLAACIGNRFELSVLSVVSEQLPVVVAERLKVAMKEGVTAPIGDAYQLLELEIGVDEDITVTFAFAHDRIQQAAYGLLNEDRKQQTHLRMGRLLLRSLTREQLKDRIFEICNHLNTGKNLIEEESIQTQLSLLNLDAGKRAKASAAYPAAHRYLTIALELLSADAWEKRYKKTLEIYAESAEAAYLSLEFDAMDRILADGFEHAKTVLDQAPLHLVKINSMTARNELQAVLDYGLSVMRKLGHPYPKGRITRLHVILSLMKTGRALRDLDMEQLRNLPLMTDERELAAEKIGTHVAPAAMFIKPGLLPLMVFHSVRTQIKMGVAPETISAWAAFGMIVASEMNKPKRGQQYGELALHLVERLQATQALPRTLHVHNALIRHWNEPLRDTLEPLQEAFVKALEYGDFDYAVMAAVVRLGNVLDAGTDLDSWGQELLDYQKALKPLRQKGMAQMVELYLQFWDNLRGNSDNPTQLVGQYFNVDEYWQSRKILEEKALNDPAAREELNRESGINLVNYEFSIWICFLFGEVKEAMRLTQHYKTRLEGLGGFYRMVRSVFIGTLVRLDGLELVQGKARRKLWREIKKYHKKLALWAEQNPDNFENKFFLVEAERLRITGDELASFAWYDKAIAASANQGFVHEQALACELCGNMHMAAGRKLIGETYLRNARDLYKRWGALAKVDQLNQRFPGLVDDVVKKSTIATTTSSSMLNVDLTALMKSLKAIASEKIHSHMLETIITASVEFAGAERGLLVLRNSEGNMHIEAEYTHKRGASRILQSVPISNEELPETLTHYVLRSQSSIVVHDALQPSDEIHGLEKDPYVVSHHVRSILCLPLISGIGDDTVMTGLIYLENNLVSNCFTQDRFNTLEIIGIAAAGRLELSRKAAFDGLTGLFNHEYFQNMLSQVFSQSRRHSKHLALILIDIDHFKQFNDTWGHQLGDLVLKEVAQLIRSTCRESDVTARYGGEEMVVILPETDQEDGLKVAELIRHAVESHQVHYEKETLTVTVSLGVATLDANTTNKDELIRRADEALYQSKEKGRNCVSLG